jgi:acyl carrier protein
MSIDRDTLAAGLLELLGKIAPEIEPAEIDRAKLLRHQVDLDSMDWLNFLIAISERYGVQIPESDYARLARLDDLLDYLGKRVPG